MVRNYGFAPVGERMTPPLCLICKLPLGPEETKAWHFDCEECTECGQPLHNSNKLIWDCLNSGIPVADITCRNKGKILEIRNKLFPATLEHLRAFNDQILSIKHEVNPTDGDLKQLYDVLHELQDAASSISILLSCTKDKIRIESNIEYTEKVKTERREKAAVDAEDNNRKVVRQAERENPALRDRRKAIEGIMKTFGFSLEAATAMIAAQAQAQPKPKVQ